MTRLSFDFIATPADYAAGGATSGISGVPSMMRLGRQRGPGRPARMARWRPPIQSPLQAAAESVPERKRLSIAKIKQDLAWRSVTGVPMEHIVLTRQQAEELVAEFERLSSQGG